jgi:hypothetical protein
MHKRAFAILGLVLLALAASGCSKCGWWFDQGPRACQSEPPR